MFDLRLPTIVPLKALLEKGFKRLKGYQAKFDELSANVAIYADIYREAWVAHEDYCKEYPESVQTRMFKQHGLELTIYPTKAVKECGTFYQQTYKFCKNVITTSDAEASEIKSKIRRNRKILDKLKGEFHVLKALRTPKTDVGLLGINIQMVSNSDHWISVTEAVNESSNHDLWMAASEMKCSICVCLQTKILYPLNSTAHAGCKSVRQDMYFWVYNAEKNEGYWYKDTVGEGNEPDFIVVTGDPPVKGMFDDFSEYLTVTYNWYISKIVDDIN